MPACRPVLPMVAKKSEMSAKSAIAVFAGFLAGQKSEMSAIAVFAGFLAGQKSEMSAIAVFAGTLVRWAQEVEAISVFPIRMPHADKVGNSGVCRLSGSLNAGNVGNSCVFRHHAVSQR